MGEWFNHKIYSASPRIKKESTFFDSFVIEEISN